MLSNPIQSNPLKKMNAKFEKKTKEAVDYRYVIIMNNELRIILTVIYVIFLFNELLITLDSPFHTEHSRKK